MTQQLSAQQQQGIDLLLAGERESAVAQELGVHRTTVWRWRREDPVFESELNSRRQEVWEAATEQLRGLVPLALDALLSELETPRRLRAAALILELAGFRASAKASVTVSPSGPTTPEAVARKRAEEVALADLMNPIAFAV